MGGGFGHYYSIFTHHVCSDFGNGRVLFVRVEIVGACPSVCRAFDIRSDGQMQIVSQARGVGGGCYVKHYLGKIQGRGCRVGTAVPILYGDRVGTGAQTVEDRIALEFFVVNRVGVTFTGVCDGDASVRFTAAGVVLFGKFRCGG